MDSFSLAFGEKLIVFTIKERYIIGFPFYFFTVWQKKVLEMIVIYITLVGKRVCSKIDLLFSQLNFKTITLSLRTHVVRVEVFPIKF